MPTQSTPSALVYGAKAVLHLELQINLLCIVIQEGLTEDENHKLPLAELEALDEKKALSATKIGMLSSSLITSIQQKGTPTLFSSQRSSAHGKKANHYFTEDWKQVHFQVGRSLCGSGRLYKQHLQDN